MITVLTNSSERYPFKKYIVPYKLSSKGLQVDDDGITRGDFGSIERNLTQRAIDKLRSNHISDVITIDYSAISRIMGEVGSYSPSLKRNVDDGDEEINNYSINELATILDKSGCRGDIILSGHLSISDCIINVRGLDETYDSEIDDVKFRIHIYKEMISGISDSILKMCDETTWVEIGVVGSMELVSSDSKDASNWVKYDGFGHVCLNIKTGTIISLPIYEIRGNRFINTNRSGLYTTCALMYGSIQYSMLNPMTEKIFNKPTRQKFTEPRINNGRNMKVAYNNKKMRYIKNYVISEKDYDKAIDEYTDFCKTHGYTRRTMAWYVRGHFRHMANGRVIFIKGYWKGPYREFQKNMDICRIRELK